MTFCCASLGAVALHFTHFCCLLWGCFFPSFSIFSFADCISSRFWATGHLMALGTKRKCQEVFSLGNSSSGVGCLPFLRRETQGGSVRTWGSLARAFQPHWWIMQQNFARTTLQTSPANPVLTSPAPGHRFCCDHSRVWVMDAQRKWREWTESSLWLSSKALF